MDEKELNTRIETLKNDVIWINNSIMAMGAYNRKKYADSFVELSLDTAIKAEKLACKLRHIVSSSGRCNPDTLASAIAQDHGIEVDEANGVVMIRLPRLLPKWKKSRSGEFLTLPLYHALQQFSRMHPGNKFTDCVVCFVHVYDKNLSLERVRDYDNLEIKHVLDAVATFFMTDDSGILCDAYNTTDYGDSDCTYVYVVKKADFPAFISGVNFPAKPLSKITANLSEKFDRCEPP